MVRNDRGLLGVGWSGWKPCKEDLQVALKTDWLLKIAASAMVTGDRLTYKIPSARKTDELYIVDLLHMRCSCPDWAFRHQSDGEPCKHIMAAKVALADQVLAEINKKLKGKYGKQTKWHSTPI